MTKTVFDNNIWLDYLLTYDQDIARVIKLSTSRKITLLSSHEILEELNHKMMILLKNKLLSKKRVITFFKVIPYLFKIYRKNIISHSLEDKRLGVYADLASSEKADYLVAYDYKEFERLDGFEEINVVALDTYIKNIF
ncbi:MAG: putative toxin-antitoxin system toxin component, PIN family [Patescibacteria group bacterium]|nr:putative toxin-antitoxin system toxin component, PIN family [Patescibacteria group bacterium]